MKQFVITLVTNSPLAIRADHAQGGSQTTQYISGTTLLGSLASAHRFMQRDQTQEFANLFLNDAVQYPNLYPALFEDDGMQNAGTPVYPLPKTAQSCKRFKGFKYHFKDDEEKRHGVRDTLIDWALFSIESDPRKRLKVMEDSKECDECHSSMDHFADYYRRGSEKESFMRMERPTDDPDEPFSGEEVVISAKVETRLQTHTGINRQTGTVQQRILYNREVLEEGMQFQGVVNLPDEYAEPFKDFVDSIGRDGLVRIGTGRTRGMGKVLLNLTKIDDGHNTFESFKKRLQAFNSTLRSQARRFEITIPEHYYFAVTLHSPAIIRDDLLRYEGTLIGERLAQLLDVPKGTFERVYQAASVQRVTGWNELWGTPKANDYAIDTGSVFLFSCKLNPDEDVLRLLYNVEEQGIGQRRSEGFGRILISDPFHREVNML